MLTRHSQTRAAFLWGTVLMFLLAAAEFCPGQTVPRADRPLLYYIPHTHWEGAVFKTREEYLQMGLPNILKALRLLKQYPEYKFTLDQVAYIKPFLERYPEQAEAFRQFVAQGRLEIVGGMDVMPDDVKPGGELFVRQIQYGKQYCREQLGVDVKVAWLLDTFGHHPQLPQLLRLAGYDSFWFCRGVPHRNLPSEFRWRGIDGTEISAIWLPGFYGLFFGPPRDAPQFSRFFRERFDSLTPHAQGPERAGLAGVDVSAPEEYVPPLVATFNRQADAPFTIRYSVPSEFAAVVARRRGATVLTNDFNPIFQGTYSSRIELKQLTREIEQLLLTGEKVGALAAWLTGSPGKARLENARQEQEMFWRAWEPLLFNQTHDLASGVMTDHVYEDTLASYDFSKRLAAEILDRDWDRFTPRIDTAGQGTPVVVFNPLAWSRTGPASVHLGFTDPGVRDIQVIDSAGQVLPNQLVESSHYPDGGLSYCKVIFMARDVPGLGYSVYHVLPRNTTEEPNTGGEDRSGNSIENEFYRATFDLGTGEMKSFYDKSLEWEVLSGPGNVVARQTDKGDLWELYRGLDGASHVAMTNLQPVPRAGAAVLSRDFQGTNSIIKRGPVFSEFTISHPFTNGSFATQVRLYAGLRRLDFQTDLVNSEKYVRYQVLFPTSIRQGVHVQEIPFGALERPAGIEFPAQHWVDYHNRKQGLALLNLGLPGNLVSENTLILSLMRAHNLGAYGFGGGYEPGMSSESGFELNQPRTFRYALVPHAGDWRQAGIYRAGLEFNQPLVARKVAAHSGVLPPRWGFLEISPMNIVLTSMKMISDGSIVLRLYEAAGQNTPGARIELRAPVETAQSVNLLEEAGRRLPVRGGTMKLDFHGFEIKTIKVSLGGSRQKLR